MELELAKKLNDNVFKVLSSTGLEGFEKAYLIANATADLKKLLTPEYMKPIMALQGSRLGFKTDRDDDGGYPEHVVKNCLIEAVLTGVQPFGNQFNIIAGNMYITKEGFGHLLNEFKGLDFDIVPGLPRINSDRTGAAIVMDVTWTINGTEKTKKLDIAVRMNKAMGTDAVIGKATRKARAWLHSRVTGIEITDGDVQDVDYKVVKDTAVTLEEVVELFEKKRELLSDAELKDAVRIIEGKEVNSYKKLHTILSAK
jgi:hypothetical protein